MRGMFEEVEETEFEKLGSSYEQIIHLCKIIFMKSEYYNQPRQMVVLLAEITNTFVNMIHAHVEPTSWFNLEPLEAAPKVVESLALIESMHATFDVCQSQIINQSGEAPGFEMCFAIGSQHLWCQDPGQNTSRIQQTKFKSRLMYDGVAGGTQRYQHEPAPCQLEL